MNCKIAGTAGLGAPSTGRIDGTSERNELEASGCLCAGQTLENAETVSQAADRASPIAHFAAGAGIIGQTPDVHPCIHGG
ncbi:hypothetical protein BN873_540005 [Candidatus Competibacter denitrificans Run_A_D11]|uniref:Uncharacterized protein n=1 Tax=Candidatus Competibacter denitrificans Run_A_D11 TaxID=1400863 RepID=W6MBK5_9GAMM|nr:hypothetical protein BN873_540005 [Candidatus Competibacter denitrificans Run_A_D11]